MDAVQYIVFKIFLYLTLGNYIFLSSYHVYIKIKVAEISNHLGILGGDGSPVVACAAI